MASPSTQSEMVSSHRARWLFYVFLMGGFTHALATILWQMRMVWSFRDFGFPEGSIFRPSLKNGWPRASIIDPTFRDDSSSSH